MPRKFLRLLAESQSIKISQMSEDLGLVGQKLYDRLDVWKKKFGIKIDGEYMITSEADVAGLIAEIERDHATWE